MNRIMQFKGYLKTLSISNLQGLLIILVGIIALDVGYVLPRYIMQIRSLQTQQKSLLETQVLLESYIEEREMWVMQKDWLDLQLSSYQLTFPKVEGDHSFVKSLDNFLRSFPIEEVQVLFKERSERDGMPCLVYSLHYGGSEQMGRQVVIALSKWMEGMTVEKLEMGVQEDGKMETYMEVAIRIQA
ncbi:MAG: hypothetical protein RR776_11845 [Niameybacter sp.]|uniref:hypothetical protein n=1 Tax=Niameybacter sp. TaxID=2033640 RepID=UPI002FC651BA